MPWPKLVTVMLLGVCLLGSALVLPATAQLRGEVPGSFLIFPEFNIAPPAATEIRISDLQTPAGGGFSYIHMHYICPGGTGTTGTCFATDTHEITPFHGTIVLDVGFKLGPSPACTHGFIIAFAEDVHHVPIASNNLIGSVQISKGFDGGPTGSAFALDIYTANAWAVQSRKDQGTPLGTFDPVSGEFLLTFGLAAESDYIALPGVLHSDFRAVTLPSVRTELIIFTPTISAGRANPAVTVNINWWNQFLDEYSTTTSFVCWREYELENLSSLFTTGELGTIYGSMQVRALTSGGYSPSILGAIKTTIPAIGGIPATTYRKMYHIGLKSSFYRSKQ